MKALLLRLWRILKCLFVVAFVGWHLTFLIYRNIADLWGADISKQVEIEKTASEQAAKEAETGLTRTWHRESAAFWDRCERLTLNDDFDRYGRYTRRYAAFTGQEQGWWMFASPLARHAYFPAVRLDFTDGSEEWMYSGNEPDPEHYRRFGGWRQRKLEDFIAKWAANEDCKGEEALVWKNYAFWVYRIWKSDHPNDRRELKWLALYRRMLEFPKPGEARKYAPAVQYLITFYAPDGRQEP